VKPLGTTYYVLVPEVEHVAQQVHGFRLVLDAVEEIHQAPFLRASMLDGPRAQVRIGKEINIFHRSST
jgi:hypothetical protein